MPGSSSARMSRSQVNGGFHVGVVVAMIGKSAWGCKLELIYYTRGNRSAIKCLPVIAGDGVGV
jgi:hypothetical protein